MEPKVGERVFALVESVTGAWRLRLLRRRRCEVPASAVDGEKATLFGRGGTPLRVEGSGGGSGEGGGGGAGVIGFEDGCAEEGSGAGYFWPARWRRWWVV